MQALFPATHSISESSCRSSSVMCVEQACLHIFICVAKRSTLSADGLCETFYSCVPPVYSQMLIVIECSHGLSVGKHCTA